MNKFLGKYWIAFFALTFIVSASLMIPAKEKISKETRVIKLLESFGFIGDDNFPDTTIFGVSAQRGKALVEEGFSTRPGGGSTKRQSKHFVCTSCHNIEKEDPDLMFNDPQARLEYTSANGLPFLQGTALYGAVNRESYYNDDYYKKYGELVVPARNDIREAIKLCAVECAQGRKLKEWEVESILAYLWTIDLKISDLNISVDEMLFLDKTKESNIDQDSAISILRSKYLKASPAHFGTAQESYDAVKNLNGSPSNGKLIYDSSCMHCHKDRKYSFFALDNNKVTFKHLLKKADSYNNHSIFQVSRFGVFPKAGKRSYMPQYPKEKMSDQQLADLQSYIAMRAAE